jgi:hypothetical protein
MTIYPNVPNVPGVPPIPRDPLIVAGAIELLTKDAVAGILSGFPQWGIFLNGAPVVLADNVASIDYKQDWTISDYQLEQGAFESYDKVAHPFECKVRFTAGGDVTNRQNFLNSIAAIAPTLTLYDIVTPEETYTSVNITHYDYRRTAINGVGLITVDVWAVQVRVTATASFQNVTSPSSASPQNGGIVQTMPTTTQISSMFASGGR